MTLPSNNGWLSLALKYGVGSVIALYLTYFMGTVMNEKLDRMIKAQEHSTQVHEEMLDVLKDVRYALREADGLTLRTTAR